MKNFSAISSVLLIAIVGGASAQIKEDQKILTTKDLDSLNSEEHYWKKVSSIETAKSQAIQLQIQNFNLQKSAGVVSEATEDGTSPKLVALGESKGGASVSDLKTFLSASISEQSVISPDDASEQEGIIASSADFELPTNMETAGVVDARGRIQSMNEPNGNQEVSEKYLEEQSRFMQQLAKFLDDKLKQQPVAESNQDKVITTDLVPPTESATPEPVASSDDSIGLTDFTYDSPSPFHKPVGKIKKVTPSGVEVVLAYEWIDFDEDTAFASAVIKKDDTTVSFYPMIRHVHKYSVKSFSESFITLVDQTGHEINITR